MSTIPWHIPARLLVAGQAHSGLTFLDAVVAFSALAQDERARAELRFEDKRLTGSLSHAAIEGYIKHLPR